MNAAHDLVDFLRPPTGRCLGAVFASYDFDERFFESVLATLLPIHADPDTDPDRFVDEGRRRLRETPVLVMVDGHRTRGGHRLPFDLVSSPPAQAFHPKLALTLFEANARLMIGSANLTEGGYGGNAELCAQLALNYKHDAALIVELGALLSACGARGEAWARIQAQLDVLVDRTAPARQNGLRILHSAGGVPLIDQLFELLPKKSRVEGVSILLGVQPEDDAVSDTDVLDTLLDALGSRSKRLPPIELALPWEGNPVAPPAEPPNVELSTLRDKLCARLEGPPAAGSLSYVVPLKLSGADVLTQVGTESVALNKRKLKAELGATPPRLWPIEEIVGVGPVEAIERMVERAPVRFFAFPELRLERGQVFRRALHGKLIAVRTLEGRTARTHFLIGAPNLPRLSAGPSHLVEAALYEVRPGHVSLAALSAELVPAPVEQLYLQNRAAPAPAASEDSPLEEVFYDVAARALVMSFRPGTRRVKVVYPTPTSETELISGEPRLREQLAEFALDRHSAEVRVEVGEESWLAPIAFRGLSALSCEEPEGELGFWHFVDHLSGRDSRPVDAGADIADPYALPEERVAPQRVFRAVRALCDEIGRPGPGLGAFIVALEGPMGLRRFADRLPAGPAPGDELALDPTEAWLYGQELMRALRAIRFDKDPAGRFKAQAVKGFLADLRARLEKVAPKSAYVKTLDRFYRGM